jgi:hypothetical protein
METLTICYNWFTAFLKKMLSLINLKLLMLKVWNLLTRPKIQIQLGRRTINFKENLTSKEHTERYPCLLISNNSDKEILIKPGDVQLNNLLYQRYLQADENFSRLKRPKLSPSCFDCNNYIYEYYSENWIEISEGGKLIHLKPNEELIFPLKISKSMIHTLFSSKTNSRLFFSNKKISIIMKVKNKYYEYGLDRKKSYECYLLS